MTARPLLFLLALAACTSGSSDADKTDDTTDIEESDTDGTDSDGTDTEGSDTEGPATIVVREETWNVTGLCWERRELTRPAEYYTADGWQPEGSQTCYDTYEVGWNGPDEPHAYTDYSSSDGKCSRWPINACPLTDPWIQGCAEVEGCCDLERANTAPHCPP